MDRKLDKRTGLAEPDVEGVEGLFEVPGPAASEHVVEDTAHQPTISRRRHLTATPTKPPRKANPETIASEAAQQERRVKTSLYLSQEALNLLHEIKYTSRKRDGRFVPLGELLDTAVRDLARKLRVDISR